MIDCAALRDKNLIASIPSFRIMRIGIIKDVAFDLDEQELASAIESPTKVLSVTRLNRTVKDDKGTCLSPSKTILMKFEGQLLPPAVSIFKIWHPVMPYILRVQICYFCYRFDHISNNCRGKLCDSRCANPKHTEAEQCPPMSIPPRYANCGGDHLPTHGGCPEFIRQRQIQILAFENIPVIEARTRFIKGPPSPIIDKLHSFKDFPILTNKNPMGDHSYSRRTLFRKFGYDQYIDHNPFVALADINENRWGKLPSPLPLHSSLPSYATIVRRPNRFRIN